MHNLTQGAVHGDMTGGIVMYSILFRDDVFIKSFLVKETNEIVGDLSTIGGRMSPPRVIASPELPSRQCL